MENSKRDNEWRQKVNPHADRDNEELWLKSNTLDDRVNVSGAVNGDVTDHVDQHSQDENETRDNSWNRDLDL